MNITKNKVIISIPIIALLIIVGVFISNKISDGIADDNAKYNKALKIDNEDLFKYGMQTNVGDAFVYGKLEAVDPVSYPGVKGQYLYIKKIEEEYVMKIRKVTVTDSKGRTTTKTETYWEWDEVKREGRKSKNIKLLNQTFKLSQFSIPSTTYITTIKVSSDYRYKYYGVPSKITGTIFTKLSNGNIDSKDIYIHKDMTIQETVESLENNYINIFFWIVWILLGVLLISWFYCLENV